MNFQQHSLSTKLVWIAVVLLLVGLTAIGFALLESWKFEGGAGGDAIDWSRLPLPRPRS